MSVDVDPVPATALLLTMAVLLALPRAPQASKGRSQPLAGPRSTRLRGMRLIAMPVIAAVVVLLLSLLDGTAPFLALIVLGSAGDVVRRLRRRRQRRQLDRNRANVLAVCESLAADVRAGVPPITALESAAPIWPPLAAVARGARLGNDVPAHLRALASTPGAGRLGVIAAAWTVAHRTGAAMASTLDLAARTLRDEQAVAAVIATEIAAARATATVLALLPVGVLVLGQGVGGDSIAFLTATPAGLVCTATGLVLAHLGLAWLDAIAEGVQR